MTRMTMTRLDKMIMGMFYMVDGLLMIFSIGGVGTSFALKWATFALARSYKRKGK